MTKERIIKELDKTYSLIENLKEKAKQLEEQKRYVEDTETLKMVKKIGITSEKLQLLNHLNQEEILKLLDQREKGQKEHEECL